MADFFSNISKEQITILKSQIERFEILRKKKIQQVIPKNKLMLPEKTLIHGTSFDIKKLENIASSGIITGQYFGIEEDGETYFCADFHRVDKDTTLEEYNNSFSYKDGRCPFGSLGKNTIAFIIPPNKELEEIAKIYELIGWQGDYLEFVRRLKENNEGGRIR